MILRNLLISLLHFIVIQPYPQQANFQESLQDYQPATISFHEEEARSFNPLPDSISLTISAYNRSFPLLLSKNHGLFSENGSFGDVGVSTFWTGRVYNESESVVSLTIQGSGMVGQIMLPEETYFLDTMYDDGFASGKRVIVYRSQDVKRDSISNVGYCGSAEGDSLLFGKRADSVPEAPNANANKECVVALAMDYSFYQKWGADSAAVGLSIMNDVSAIYMSNINISLSVGYLFVETFANQVLNSSISDISAYLAEFKDKADKNSLPNGFSKQDYCVAHLLTGKPFSGKVGLAYTNQVCQSANGAYTGLSTMSILGFTILRSYLVTTVAHEIGHNFGSSHDTAHATNPPGNPASCDPEYKFIMYPALQSPGINSFKFSSCSKYLMNSLISTSTCLRNQGQVSNKAANSSDDLWIPYPEDQCAQAQQAGQLSNISPDSWTDCLNFATIYKPDYVCTLLCVKKSQANGQCSGFANPLGIPAMIPKRDGFPCDATDPSKVCISGTCKTDTRKNLCTKSVGCCDSFGNVHKKGVKCRSPKPQVLEGGMGCRLDNDICLGIDAEFCPPSVEPPGTSCSCDESGNDCKGACGQEAFLGWCLSTEDSTKVLGKYYTSSLANPCSNYTCKDGLKCIGVTGDAVCVKMKADSCKFRCGSKVDEIYTCSCESDCKTKGTCCMDYSAFCRPLKSPFTVEGFIQRLLLLWDKERMNLIYGGIGVVVFVIALCVRSCRRRSRKQSQK